MKRYASALDWILKQISKTPTVGGWHGNDRGHATPNHVSLCLLELWYPTFLAWFSVFNYNVERVWRSIPTFLPTSNTKSCFFEDVATSKNSWSTSTIHSPKPENNKKIQNIFEVVSTFHKASGKMDTCQCEHWPVKCIKGRLVQASLHDALLFDWIFSTSVDCSCITSNLTFVYTFRSRFDS